MHMPINLGQLFEVIVSKHMNADVLAYADGRKIKYSTLNDTANMSTGEWHHKQLKDLKNHFSDHFYFKTHPLKEI